MATLRATSVAVSTASPVIMMHRCLLCVSSLMTEMVSFLMGQSSTRKPAKVRPVSSSARGTCLRVAKGSERGLDASASTRLTGGLAAAAMSGGLLRTHLPLAMWNLAITSKCSGMEEGASSGFRASGEPLVRRERDVPSAVVSTDMRARADENA
jgi:hypothetical protein